MCDLEKNAIVSQFVNCQFIIKSQNVCGLGDQNKRRQIFMHLRENNSVICSQETHSTKEVEDIFRAEWGGGNVFWSHGTSEARGVGILISKSSELEVVSSDKDDVGRYVIVQFKVGCEYFVLANVYAPNKDNPLFFSELVNKMMNLEGKKMIIGDFNLILDNKLDCTDKIDGLVVNNDKSKEYLLKFMEEASFTDVWHDRNPEKRTYTFRREKPKYVARRIDLLLCEQALTGWMREIKIKPSFKSDHSILECEILIHAIERGRGVWKLNNSVLKEQSYCKQINKIIDETIRIGSNLNPGEKWDMVKLEVIKQSQIYCRKRASDTKLILSQLEMYLEQFEDESNMSDSEKKIYDRTKKDYEHLMNEKAHGAILRSKSQFYNEGERNTKYFFSLEKSRSGAKNVSTLIEDNENVVKNPKEILKKMVEFYKNLYT